MNDLRRFSGPITRPVGPTSPASSLDRLRLAALYRRIVVLATVVYYASALLAALLLYTAAHRNAPASQVLAKGAFFSSFGMLPIVVVGGTAMPYLSRRDGPMKTLALSAPLVNVAVVASMLRESRTRLEDHRVVLGWFVDDWSQATEEPSSVATG